MAIRETAAADPAVAAGGVAAHREADDAAAPLRVWGAQRPAAVRHAPLMVAGQADEVNPVIPRSSAIAPAMTSITSANDVRASDLS
jgi:hypothetical protein